MNNEKYEDLEIELITFQAEDIITASKPDPETPVE